MEYPSEIRTLHKLDLFLRLRIGKTIRRPKGANLFDNNSRES